MSKRTVYDHFGDKQTVFAAVMDRVAGALLTSVRTAVEHELPEGCDPAPSLLAFARRITTKTFASSDYVLFRTLLASHAATMPPPIQAQDTPEELLTERMASFTGPGRVREPGRRTVNRSYLEGFRRVGAARTMRSSSTVAPPASPSISSATQMQLTAARP